MLVTKFHDFNRDHVSFVYDLYEVLNVDIKNFVKTLLRKKNLDYCYSHTLNPMSLHFCVLLNSYFG